MSAILPIPAQDTYGAEDYPALNTETQLKLFDIFCDFEHSAPLWKVLGWATGVADAWKPSAIGRADWAAEASALHGRFGVRTFFWRAFRTGGIPDWAGEFHPRIRQTGWQYGMTVDGQFEGEVSARAHAAGCRVLAVTCRTGSQRLLERACGPRASVGKQARLLRLAANSGCYTHAEFTFPTAEDDHHTRDETLRFIDKTHPDSVTIHLSPDHLRNAWDQHFSLIDDIEKTGVSTAWSADEVLALRAGEAACGAHLGEETDWALASGDGRALSAAIKQMNRGLEAAHWGAAAGTWRDVAGLI